MRRPAVLTGDSVLPACLPANPAEVALKLDVADLGDGGLGGFNAILVGWGKVNWRWAHSIGLESNVLDSVLFLASRQKAHTGNFKRQGAHTNILQTVQGAHSVPS